MFNPTTEFDFKISSYDHSSYITFKLVEYFHSNYPSISCSIEVRDDKFSATDINAWFSHSDLLTFINDFERLEKTRTGKASLSAMTSSDFNISFESYNRKGHIAAFYSTSQSKHLMKYPSKEHCVVVF